MTLEQRTLTKTNVITKIRLLNYYKRSRAVMAKACFTACKSLKNGPRAGFSASVAWELHTVEGKKSKKSK
jgi:hypothetical protein